MDSSTLLLAQTLSLSGLIGATGAYAGIIRRRNVGRLAAQRVALVSAAAVERVDRHLSLSRLEHTFVRSAYRRRDR
jgi:hypothetical protein